MDAAVKHLRDGLVREELGCAFAVVHDSLEVVGGRDVMIQLAQGYMAAVAGQRAQAQRVRLLVLERDPQTLVQGQSEQVVSVVDVHRSTQGWAETGVEPAGTSTSGSVCFNTLDQLESLLFSSGSGGPLGPADHSIGLIIDSVSHLFLHFTAHQVMRFLVKLRSHPAVSCILTACHKDLHPGHVVAGLEHLSTCTIQLQPLSPLHQEVAARHNGIAPHGLISFRYKRRQGCMHAESLLYSLLTLGGLSTGPVPAVLSANITAEALVALSVKSKPTPSSSGQEKERDAAPSAMGVTGGSAAQGAAGLAAQAPVAGSKGEASGVAAGKSNAGGMRLGLTEQERQAKQQVRLPYEHQGQGRQYETGDFRDYLPVAAGGHAGTQHIQDYAAAGVHVDAGTEVARLGHILYVRDSEEEHDSDEDPDDDLDI